MRWIALFRNFGHAWEANWGQACLTYLYSVLDTLSRGTLSQRARPWKLPEVRPFSFSHVIPHIVLCTLTNYINSFSI